jgi:hypothetical protein
MPRCFAVSTLPGRSWWILTLALAPWGSQSASQAASQGAPESRPTSRPATRPNLERIERERAANLDAYNALYLPRQQALQLAHKGKWVVIADGKLIPRWRDAGWRPFDDHAAADKEATRLVPEAQHRFIWRIGEEGDREIDLGGCELTQILGTHGMAAHPMLDRPLFSTNAPLRFRWQDREVTVGIESDDRRPFVRPLLGDPTGTTHQHETLCVSTGSTGSIMLRGPVADALGLQRWEIPGAALVTSILFWQPTGCRRACVRMRIKAEGFDLDHVFAAEIWPDDREDQGLPRKAGR